MEEEEEEEEEEEKRRRGGRRGRMRTHEGPGHPFQLNVPTASGVEQGVLWAL